MVSSITTAWRALASASGPCWAASWFARSTSAWKPAFLISVSRTEAAISAAACCSCPTASRSAMARAMRAFCSTSAWCGTARFSM